MSTTNPTVGGDATLEALIFAHDKLVEYRIAHTLNQCRYGGASKAVSQIVNKTRAAITKATGG